MAAISTSFQIIGQKRLNRKFHIWKSLNEKDWKCLLCGGVSNNPTDEDTPPRYETLTEEERAVARNPRKKS